MTKSIQFAYQQSFETLWSYKNIYSKKTSYVQFSIQFMQLTKCLKHNHEGLSQKYQKGTNKRSLMTSFLYEDMYIPNNNKKNLSSFSQFVKDTKSFRHIMWQIFLLQTKWKWYLKQRSIRICFILTKHKPIYCKMLGWFDVFF